jgi:TetR/AcrR family transcriptional repressor of lmrAB and yxaGH operons
MRQSGLSGAGINQILAHSGAPKGSMYYHFPGGKLQIAAEALELYGQRVAEAFETALSSRKKPGDKIRALFGLVADRLENGKFEQSCAAGAVALDLQTDVADLQLVVASVMASWQTVVASHLPQRTRTRRQSFAGLVISAIEGAYVRGRAARTRAPFVEASEWLARLIEQEAD